MDHLIQQSEKDRIFEKILSISPGVTGYTVIQSNAEYIKLYIKENDIKWEPVYGKTVEQALTTVLLGLEISQKNNKR